MSLCLAIILTSNLDSFFAPPTHSLWYPSPVPSISLISLAFLPWYLLLCANATVCGGNPGYARLSPMRIFKKCADDHSVKVIHRRMHECIVEKKYTYDKYICRGFSFNTA